MKSMVSDKKLTNAVGGKSARACDNCIKKRARWYCAADDAFLCQSCDSSVHSANPLARRHERVRLKTSSLFNSIDDESTSSRTRLQISVPMWHHGFTKKARTPRQKKKSRKFSRVNIPVPEIGSEEYSGHEENDDHEQLLYRVPIFDPFVAELCNSNNDNQDGEKELFCRVENGSNFGGEAKTTSSFQGFLPSEMDLAEFAADVESLLGKGLEDESFDMEGLGILDCDFNNENKPQPDCPNSYTERVKVEEEETVSQEIRRHDSLEIDLGRESFELNFDYEDSPVPCEEDEDCKHQINGGDLTVDCTKFGEDSGKTLLNLNYEGVLSSWGDKKPPWTSGDRPDLNACDFWVSNLGMGLYGDAATMNGSCGGGVAAMADGDREARVSRYREKRRTRLFAKKIRYEVRKLNAEKRPRMKGRFVKRVAVPAAATPLPLLNNK